MATIKTFSEYVFDAVAPNATAELKFDKPVKRVYTSTPIISLVDDTKINVIGYLTDYVIFEFPNNFGYPKTLYVKNTSGEAITPHIHIVEYGDTENEDYFTLIS